MESETSGILSGTSAANEYRLSPLANPATRFVIGLAESDDIAPMIPVDAAAPPVAIK
jgi:hypothetical protein